MRQPTHTSYKHQFRSAPHPAFHPNARVGEKRNDLWVWNAVMKERGGVRWMDFEAGGKDEATLML